MKKVVIFYIFLCLIAYSFAFEGGGLFSTALDFDIGSPAKTDNPSIFSNPNKLSLWLKRCKVLLISK